MRLLRPFLLLGLLAASCGRVAQAPECVAYVECVKARDTVLTTTTDVVRFESAGACWNNEDLAGGCVKACSKGLKWLGSLSGAPKECTP
ncbi:MAG: hypothetical protein QM765_18710 [Myxococcales bacterium]